MLNQTTEAPSAWYCAQRFQVSARATGVGDDSRAVGGRFGRLRPHATEMLVAELIQSEVGGDVMPVPRVAIPGPGQPLGVPSLDGLVPPGRPFHDRQAVERLEFHDRPEAFAIVHSAPFPSRNRPSCSTAIVAGVWLPRLDNRAKR
jgi:hypothetical protein